MWGVPVLADPTLEGNLSAFEIDRRGFRDLEIARFQDFEISGFRDFKISRLRNFKISGFSRFRVLEISNLEITRFQDFEIFPRVGLVGVNRIMESFIFSAIFTPKLACNRESQVLFLRCDRVISIE